MRAPACQRIEDGTQPKKSTSGQTLQDVVRVPVLKAEFAASFCILTQDLECEPKLRGR
jgi:hypothetical protein